MGAVGTLGEVIGNYEIVSELKRGGMGVLYAARHVAIGQQVVIKKLQPEHAANQEVVQRFFQEARAAAALDDPGVVRIFDQGVLPDGSAYIVMEFLQGESLADRLKRIQRLPVDRALILLRQAARAVSKAHSRGIIHRDLKPDNLFVVPDLDLPGGERIKVLDFGIAKLVSEKPWVQTMAQMPMGTPGYMSPEQWTSAGQVDARTDIYALGIILFEMVTGQLPFPGPGLTELIDQHRFMPPPLPSSIDPKLGFLDAVVARALSKQARDRFSSLEEMVAALPAIGHPALSMGPVAAPAEREPWSAATMAVEAPRSAVAAAPTTLRGSAAAHQVKPGRSRRPWAIGAGFLLATGVGLLAVQSWSGQAEEPSRGDEGDLASLPPAVDARTVAVRAPAPDAGVIATSVPERAVARDAGVDAAMARAPAVDAGISGEAAAAPRDAGISGGATTASRDAGQPKLAAPERKPLVAATVAKPLPAKDPARSARPVAPTAPAAALEAPSEVPAFVDVLGKAEMDQGILKVKSEISRCGKLSSHVRGRVSVKFTVGDDGMVAFANVLEAPDETLGLCVLVAIESATFVKSKRGGRFTYRVSF